MTRKEVEQLQLAIQYFTEDEPTLENCSFDYNLFRKAMKKFHGYAGGIDILKSMVKTYYQKNSKKK